MGDTPGLGLIAGQVRQLSTTAVDGGRLKVPVRLEPHSAGRGPRVGETWLLDGVEDSRSMFLIQLLAAQPSSTETVVANASYGGHTFCAAVAGRSVAGCQFHPERTESAACESTGTSRPQSADVWREGSMGKGSVVVNEHTVGGNQAPTTVRFCRAA